MKIINYSAENKSELVNIINRSTANFEEALTRAREIMDDVRDNGNSTLYNYTKKYDNFNLNSKNLMVTRDEIAAAVKRIKKNDKKLFSALKHAHRNIMKYHRVQYDNINKNLKIETDNGIEISERVILHLFCGSITYNR